MISHLIFFSFLCESKIFKRAVEIDIWVLKLTMAFKRWTTIQFCPRCSIWVKCAVPPYIVSNTFEVKIKIDYWFLKLRLRLIKLRLIIVISFFFVKNLYLVTWLCCFAESAEKCTATRIFFNQQLFHKKALEYEVVTAKEARSVEVAAANLIQKTRME